MAKLSLETGKHNKILRADCEAVTNFSDPSLRTLIADMKETLASIENGVGLAAPQVGKNLRLFVVSPKLNAPQVFINALIVKRSQKEEEFEEGCLSLPGVFGLIKRAKWVTAQAQDEFGKKFKLKAEGLLAQLIQHEADHLEGKLYIDRAKKLFKIEDGKVKELNHE